MTMWRPRLSKTLTLSAKAVCLVFRIITFYNGVSARLGPRTLSLVMAMHDVFICANILDVHPGHVHALL